MTNTDYQDQCMALGCTITANQPVILWSGPGQGKSSVLSEIFNFRSWHLETVMASIREPSDFAGLPIVDAATGSVVMAPPAWAKQAATHEISGVFFDEISTAAPATQAALLRVALDKVVGDLALPPGTRIIAAANPPDVAAGGWDLAPPLANRFVHIRWSLPADVVRDGFTVGWPEVPIPNPEQEDLDREVASAKVLVGTFLNHRPELVTVMPTNSEDFNGGYPTPRSWEMASVLYGTAKASGANSNVVQILMSGTVGLAASSEFLTWAANLDLPDPERLLAHPEEFVVPSDRGDKVFAIAASVHHAMEANLTAERWVNAGRILGRMAEANHGDIAVTFGSRWGRCRPQGAFPHEETTRGLIPMLGALSRIITEQP